MSSDGVTDGDDEFRVRVEGVPLASVGEGLGDRLHGPFDPDSVSGEPVAGTRR